jgi:hypothetical protein
LDWVGEHAPHVIGLTPRKSPLDHPFLSIKCELGSIEPSRMYPTPQCQLDLINEYDARNSETFSKPKKTLKSNTKKKNLFPSYHIYTGKYAVATAMSGIHVETLW